jgi:hypothetical protein
VKGSFRRDSQVSLAGDRYQAEIPEAWRVLAAYGGMVFAVGQRAAHAATERPSLAPVFASAVDIETRTLAVSQNTAHATATLYVPGDERPKVHLTAVFGKRLESPYRLHEAKFPEGIWGPEESLPNGEAAGLLGKVPIMEQLEVRWAHDFDTRPGRGGEVSPGPAVTCSWMRLRDVPRLEDGTIDPLSYAIPADALASALFRGLGLTRVTFIPVTLSMDMHVFRTTRREWLLQHVRVVRLEDGYASGIVEIWDDEKNLLALSTQLRFCKPFA